LGVHDILEQVQVLVLLRDSVGDQHDETKMVPIGLQGAVQVHVNLVHLEKLVSRVKEGQGYVCCLFIYLFLKNIW